ncbi:MAG TPA: hypothetical protein VGO03_08210 [Acidimicrobiia bacterium]|jgi:uncharacterized membrane protein
MRATSTPIDTDDTLVEENTRLTAATGAVLLVVLAAEGITILRVDQLLSWHAFLGVLLIPLALVKLLSTGRRFVAYYRGDPAFVRRGPPHLILRVLGPFVSLLTVLVLASGVILIVEGHGGQWFFVHKASFILWFAAMTVHVLGHIVETLRIAPLDYTRAAALRRAGVRRAVLAVAIVVGIAGGVLIQSSVHSWHHDGGKRLGTPAFKVAVHA